MVLSRGTNDTGRNNCFRKSIRILFRRRTGSRDACHFRLMCWSANQRETQQSVLHTRTHSLCRVTGRCTEPRHWTVSAAIPLMRPHVIVIPQRVMMKYLLLRYRLVPSFAVYDVIPEINYILTHRAYTTTWLSKVFNLIVFSPLFGSYVKLTGHHKYRRVFLLPFLSVP